MIANTSLQAFSVPTRPAATAAPAAATTAANRTPPADGSETARPTGGTRGALLDRWA